jgi:hypothetical protein
MAKGRTNGGAPVRHVVTPAQTAPDAQVAASAPPQNDAADAEQERKARRRAFIFVIVFIVLIIIVIVGIPYLNQWRAQRQAAKDAYNGFDFAQMREGSLLVWATNVQVHGQPYDLQFYNHPRDTENVSLEPGITNRFLGSARPKLIYLTFDKDQESIIVIAGVEISRITGEKAGILNIDTRGALKTAPPSNVSATAVVTCAEATPQIAVLSFDLGTQNAIFADSRNPDCIHLEFSSANESLRVADRFVYGLLKIMPG